MHRQFDKFKSIMVYLGVIYGIRIILVDESYSSKASFIDNDPIPTYGEEGAVKVKFSGKRAPIRYASEFGDMYRKNGFGGLYTASDGTVINSDLNGSANIGRKVIPNMYDFGKDPIFQT